MTSNNDNDESPSLSRRNLLSQGGVAAALFFTSVSPQSAHATYSAYVNREQDWQERNNKGEVQYSSAKQLRSQLKQIVPQNDDARSKVFCPNGPSSAVSPLMENKCSDTLQAAPSIYGRSNDVVGNSIPGFSKSEMNLSGNSNIMVGDITASGISFPKYK